VQARATWRLRPAANGVFILLHMARRFDPDHPALPPELQVLLPTPEELASAYKGRGQQHAVLDENGEAQPADFMQWARLEKNHRQRVIERAELTRQLPGLEAEVYCVSTVFIGLNHQYMPGRKPLWFETMVFGPPYERYYEIFKKTQPCRDDLWMERCTTRAEALAMHARGLSWLKAYIAGLDAKMEPYPYEPTTSG
jgi:hypothetical protein